LPPWIENWLLQTKKYALRAAAIVRPLTLNP
jgi:hypothetical protein